MSEKKKEDNKKEKSEEEKENSEEKEVCETFEVEKDGKEKVVTKCGDFEEKHATKKELKEQKKTLRNVLIGLAIVVIAFVGIIFFFKSMSKFTYENTEFELTKEGSLLLYQTTIPVYYQGQIRDYNFYLRKDPRKLDTIEFEGGIDLLKNVVVNMSEGLNCDGDGIIGVANLAKLWQVLGANVIKDENATCDPDGRYIYLNIREGEKTKIVEKGSACYDIIVSNCRVLEATERFMIEMFVKVNSLEDFIPTVG